jgi:hypothetical protein
MLGSADRESTLSSCDWNGERVECDLCQRVRLCTEHSDMVTCRDCQADFLPRKGVF